MRRDDDVAFEAWNNLHNDVYMRLQEAIIRIDELTRELNEYKMKENDHK
jgi:hypothetical protein